ncbi:MAG: hypothetical protein KDA96_16140, partial [Planctomycetaceae bacterium]|nr:hypothetical protein [Planctomycetaceae bacterium]
KHCTAIVTRQEDIFLNLACSAFPTAENLLVDVHVRFAVQLSDVALFLNNLMGSADAYSVDQLQRAVGPLIEEAVRSVIATQSIDDLSNSESTTVLDSAVDQKLALSFRRYGIRFSQIQTVRIGHARYNEYREKQGHIWLMSREQEQTQKLADLYHEEQLLLVVEKERANQIEALLSSVEAERKDSELESMVRRVRVRQQMRQAVLTDEFHSLNTAEEKQRFLEGLDKNRLLREAEMHQLREILQQQAEDRAAERTQLIRKLAIEEEFEIRQLKEELSHQLELRCRQHELELTHASESEATRQWRDALQKQSEAAQHQREEKRKAWEDRRSRFQDYWATHREDQIAGLLHEVEKERIRGGADVEKAERRHRVQLMESELQLALEQNLLASKRRRDDYEAEVRKRDLELDAANKVRTSQFEHDLAVLKETLQQQVAMNKLDVKAADARINNEINQQNLALSKDQDRHEMEMRTIQAQLTEASRDAQHRRDTETRRMELEFTAMREDRLAKYRLDRMDRENERLTRLTGLGPDGWIAFAESANAAILADKEKERLRQETEARKAEADSAARQAEANSRASVEAARSDGERAALQQALRIKDEVTASKDDALNRMENLSDKMMQMMQQNNQHSLNTIAGLAATHAQQPAHQSPPPQPVIVPPVVVSGGNTVLPSATGQQVSGAPSTDGSGKTVVLCGNCRSQVPATESFCGRCGAKI